MRELAMFPLEQTVLPSTIVPLHIFEERYRALARFLAALDEPEFGITMIERGREVGGEDLRSNAGVVARVVQAEEFPDGRWGMVAMATRRIRVERWADDDPYPKALVEDWPDSDAGVSPESLNGLSSGLRRILAAARLLAPDRRIDEPAIDFDDPTYGAWQLIVSAQLGALDNQRLLREPGWQNRAVLAHELFDQRAEVLEALVGYDCDG
ncbi:MAG: LON peptidase substrate-binding domain-containing protein [Acidimicrobiaceae bacterium]|nr:LON peptidase substrate-binding domain-containing protein [Acidimicrobiaceae bacterium]